MRHENVAGGRTQCHARNSGAEPGHHRPDRVVVLAEQPDDEWHCEPERSAYHDPVESSRREKPALQAPTTVPGSTFPKKSWQRCKHESHHRKSRSAHNACSGGIAARHRRRKKAGCERLVEFRWPCCTEVQRGEAGRFSKLYPVRHVPFPHSRPWRRAVTRNDEQGHQRSERIASGVGGQRVSRRSDEDQHDGSKPQRERQDLQNLRAGNTSQRQVLGSHQRNEGLENCLSKADGQQNPDRDFEPDERELTDTKVEGEQNAARDEGARDGINKHGVAPRCVPRHFL